VRSPAGVAAPGTVPGAPDAGSSVSGVRTRGGLDRFVGFLDSVVAIAITLRVLPLIELLGDVGHRSLATVLRENEGRFGAFLLSFMVISLLWRAHHRIVEQVDGYDDAFVTVNLVWVLTIVVLPFATQVAAVYGNGERLAVGVYLGAMAVSSLCLAALSLLISRRDSLRRDGVTPQDATPPGWQTSTALLIAALALGVAVPAVGYASALLVLLEGPIRRVAARGHRRGGSSEPPTMHRRSPLP
jgi:TMEM175 potassium channel family protein